MPPHVDPFPPSPKKTDGPLPDPYAESLLPRQDANFRHRLMLIIFLVAGAGVLVVEPNLPCGIFAGLLLGAFLVRLTQLVQRSLKLPYLPSILLVVVSLLAIFSLLAFVFGTRFTEQMSALSDELTNAVDHLLEKLREYEVIEANSDEVSEAGSDLLSRVDTSALIGGVFSSITGTGAAMVLILFVGFFLAFDPTLYRNSYLSLIPYAYRPRAAALLSETIDTLWWWTLGRLFAMAVIGVATSIGLWLLGIPMPIMLGTLAGLVSFVPTIGAILAIIPAVLVSFQQGPWSPLYVIGLYLAIQAIENNLLTPFVQQKAVDVPPVLMIIAEFFMGLFVGALGVAVATPMAAVGIVWVRKLYIEPYIESPSNRKSIPQTADAPDSGDSE